MLSSLICLTALAELYTPSPHMRAPDKKWLTVRLQFIRCEDNDGRRACDFTWDDTVRQMEIANRVYATARVRFVCDQRRDFTTVKNTAVNSQDIIKSPLTDQGIVEANKLVTKFRGKLVVFCRHGASQRPTGTGFSGGDSFAVFLPSMRHTNAGPWMLAHEMGHYFGLSHTFRSRMRSLEQAEAVLKDHGNDPSIFDGDGFSDTGPDPGMSPPKDGPRDSMTLNGIKINIPYGNIMSYMNWAGHEWLSPQQVDRIRETYEVRQKVGMGWQSNELATNLQEAENLTPTYGDGCTGEVQPMDRFGRHRWSGGSHLFCHSEQKGYVDLHFKCAVSGPINLDAYMTLARDYGVVRFLLDGVRIGRSFDGFARSVVSSGRVSLGRQVLSAGEHTLRVQVISKNASATGTNFGVDGITVGPAEADFDFR